METNVTQNGKTNLMQVINASPATKIPDIPEIAARFKKLFSIIHPGQKADIFYEAEKFHFMKLIQESETIKSCSKLSLYGCFMDVAVNGLSFDPSFKHLYLVPFNVNVGTKQTPKWEKRAQLQISGYGELVLRQKQNQIKYADNPVLVYEDEEFSFGNRNGKGFVEHVSKLPRTSNKIVACYLRIVRPDDSVDYKVITGEDMERFRKFSKDADKSKAWNEGIGGMWQAKCIKHAFKNYPKVRTGDFSQLASQTVDEDAVVVNETPAMQVPEQIDYGTPGTENVNHEEVDDDSFASSSSNGSTVHVGADEDDF
jgi:recombinational DNA repair protein RecT